MCRYANLTDFHSILLLLLFVGNRTGHYAIAVYITQTKRAYVLHSYGAYSGYIIIIYRPLYKKNSTLIYGKNVFIFPNTFHVRCLSSVFSIKYNKIVALVYLWISLLCSFSSTVS